MTEQPFAAGADFLKRALAVPAKVAADLAVAGGILRCGSCGNEQPLGDVASHLSSGWPKCCGLTMTWVTLKMLLAEQRDVPEGFELAAVISEKWRIETGKLCARRVGRATCRQPSAAELNRGTRNWMDVWWPYCLDHLYANWIENGQVMHWILREKADA